MCEENKKTEWLLCALFGSNRKLMWCEPPYSEHGKKLGVYHYRLFCDEAWKPRSITYRRPP
jgi:hypothetical protein